MVDKRQKNKSWTVTNDNGSVTDWQQVNVAVLMDIRDELQSVVRLLNCHRIPRALDAVVAMHKQGVKRRVSRKRKAT